MNRMYTTLGVILAEGEDGGANTDPGVTPGWNALPEGVKTFLTDIAGTAMTVGIILGVIVLIAGAIVWGFGALSNRPGVGSLGVKIVVIAAVVALLCAGANAFISFFAGKGVTIFL